MPTSRIWRTTSRDSDAATAAAAPDCGRPAYHRDHDRKPPAPADMDMRAAGGRAARRLRTGAARRHGAAVDQCAGQSRLDRGNPAPHRERRQGRHRLAADRNKGARHPLSRRGRPVDGGGPARRARRGATRAAGAGRQRLVHVARTAGAGTRHRRDRGPGMRVGEGRDDILRQAGHPRGQPERAGPPGRRDQPGLREGHREHSRREVGRAPARDGRRPRRRRDRSGARPHATGGAGVALPGPGHRALFAPQPLPLEDTALVLDIDKTMALEAVVVLPSALHVGLQAAVSPQIVFDGAQRTGGAPGAGRGFRLPSIS